MLTNTIIDNIWYFLNAQKKLILPYNEIIDWHASYIIVCWKSLYVLKYSRTHFSDMNVHFGYLVCYLSRTLLKFLGETEYVGASSTEWTFRQGRGISVFSKR